jgi:hypothetical protein
MNISDDKESFALFTINYTNSYYIPKLKDVEEKISQLLFSAKCIEENLNVLYGDVDPSLGIDEAVVTSYINLFNAENVFNLGKLITQEVDVYREIYDISITLLDIYSQISAKLPDNYQSLFDTNEGAIRSYLVVIDKLRLI